MPPLHRQIFLPTVFLFAGSVSNTLGKGLFTGNSFSERVGPFLSALGIFAIVLGAVWLVVALFAAGINNFRSSVGGERFPPK